MQPKVELELEGFKIEIGKFKVVMTGERRDIPQLKEVATAQVRNLVTAGLPAIEVPAEEAVAVSAPAPLLTSPSGRTRRATRARGGGASPAVTAAPLPWKPDGSEPHVGWSNFEKGAWLLSAFEKDHKGAGLTAEVIAATFSHHFPSAGLVKLKYLRRDLERNAGGPEPKVTKGVDEKWFITDYGKGLVVELVTKLKGSNGAA